MKISDEGFLFFLKKYEENSLLIKIISKNNGIVSGYVKKLKNTYNYQMCNLVKFKWKSNTNTLGVINLEVIKSYMIYIINDKFNLYLINTINTILNTLINYEWNIDNIFFIKLKNIIDLLSNNENKIFILKEFLFLESNILSLIGINNYNENNIKNILNISNINRDDIFKGFNLINNYLKQYLYENNMIDKYKIILNLKKNLLKNF